MRVPRAVFHEPQTEEQKREERVENIIALAVMFLVVAAAIFLFMRWWDAHHTPLQPGPDTVFKVGLGTNLVLGDPNAPVTIVEFADYECSSCAAFYKDAFLQLKTVYIDTGKVQFAFRDYPIETTHPEAFAAAVAARCAGDQSKYWEFHDALYNSSAPLNSTLYDALAMSLNLNMTQFDACRSSGSHDQEIREDYVEGINQGRVVATPTFFIAGKRYVGNQPYADFQTAIEQALHDATR